MKYTLFAIFIILVLVGAGIYFFNQSQYNLSDTYSDDAMMKKDDSMEKTDSLVDSMEGSDSGMEKSDGSMDESGGHGQYIEFSESALQSANGKRVLFFYANWCPTCRPADEDFKQNSAELPEGLTIIRVNYNDSDTDAAEKALAQKYGITYQHTYVQIDEEGNEVAKWNGGQTEKLLSSIK